MINRRLFFLVGLFFSAQACAVKPVTCKEKSGFVSNGSLIKMLDTDCTGEENFCGFLVSSPVFYNGRKILSFTMLKLDKGMRKMQANLAFSLKENMAEASIYGSSDELKKIEIHAVYEPIDACRLHSILKIKDHIAQ